MRLVEERHNFVAGSESRNAAPDRFHCACAIGAWDDIVFGGERVFALSEDSAVARHGDKRCRRTLGMARSR